MPRDLRFHPLIPALHPERDALLAAVRDAHPDDDLPALVYADWQDEHGQPEHAELIRVMVELAKARKRDPASKARRPVLLARMKELFKTPALKPLREMESDTWRFERGFLREASVAVMGSEYASGPQNRYCFSAPDRLDVPAYVPFDKIAGATLELPPNLNLSITAPLATQPWLRRFDRARQVADMFGVMFRSRIVPGVMQPLLDSGQLAGMRVFEVNQGVIAGDELVRVYLHRSTTGLRELVLGQLEKRVTPAVSHHPSRKADQSAVEQIVSAKRAEQFTSFGHLTADVDEPLAKILLASEHITGIRTFRYLFGKITARTQRAFVERFGPPERE